MWCSCELCRVLVNDFRVQFARFIWVCAQTAIISLYNIKRPILIMEVYCVYCVVRTEYLNVTPVLPDTGLILVRGDGRLGENGVLRMPDSSVKIVTMLLNGLPGCDMRHGWGYFFPTAFRRTLVHIQPPIRWIPAVK